MTLLARSAAQRLMTLGYMPIPLTHKSKRPVQASWQNMFLGLRDLDTHFPADRQYGIGLLLGTEVQDGVFIYSVDVDFAPDDPVLLHRIRMAFANPDAVPAKRGKKGLTFFGRRQDAFKKKVYSRKDSEKLKVGIVEILGKGQQTVIPPSIHPETGSEYVWVDPGPALTDCPPLELPILSDQVLDEIKMAVEDPLSKFFDVNEMMWNGPEGGGNVHDSVLVAIAILVQRQWDDTAIEMRMNWAAKRMLARLPEHKQLWDWRAYEEDVRRMVSGARDKKFDEEKTRGGNSKADRRIAASNIIVESYGGDNSVATIDNVFRVYRDGWWQAHTRDDVAHRFLRDPELATWAEAADARAIADRVLLSARRISTLDTPQSVIVTKSRSIDIDSGLPVDHSPHHMVTAVLPFEWDDRAQCPVYDAFVRSLFTSKKCRDEDRDRAVATFEEFAGLTFVNDVTFQRAMIVQGPPATGKSTMLKVLESMHHPSARISLDLFNLREERTVASLVGKLVALTYEISPDDFVPSDMFKMVADGSTVPARRLYEEMVDMPMTARMVIACNEMFKYRDSSGAMERRMIILRSRERIPEREQDYGLQRKLMAERPGIFMRWMTALRRLRERGYFEPPTYTKDLLQQAAEESDPVLRWYQERTHQGVMSVDDEYKWEVPVTALGNIIGTSSVELYADFAEWLEARGYRKMNDMTWGTRLTARGYPAYQQRLLALGNRALRVRDLHLIDKGVPSSMKY